MDNTGKSILIISNTSRLCKSLSVLLKSNPGFHSITEAPDIISGVNWISEHKSDIVFIDAALPNEGACHVLKKIREDFPFCHSILLAHSSSQENKTLSTQADAVLSEGFSTEKLFQVLESLIDVLEDSDITY